MTHFDNSHTVWFAHPTHRVYFSSVVQENTWNSASTVCTHPAPGRAADNELILTVYYHYICRVFELSIRIDLPSLSGCVANTQMKRSVHLYRLGAFFYGFSPVLSAGHFPVGVHALPSG
ncbi:hypothetical protein FKM82_025382 [Ascaphus truei]